MNSEEIAKRANVSRSTVSRVLNNYKNVPIETREKVQAVIDEYGYTPNISARTLAGKANNIIGLFIADVGNTEGNKKWIGVNSPYNSDVLSNVITSCKRRGYLTLVETIGDLEECSNMEQYFANRMLFGGIFIGFPYKTKELNQLIEKKYNVVFIDQFRGDDDVECVLKLVNSDDEVGGYMATKYLIDNGHRKIAHITGDYRLSSIQRKRGYCRALEEAGIKINDEMIVHGQYREGLAYEEAMKLLHQNAPTAIFVGNDIMALGVVRAANDLCINIPTELSIVGYDNLEMAEWLKLDLTTISTPMDSIAEWSVAMLFMKGKGLVELCKPELIERSSVKNIRNE